LTGSEKGGTRPPDARGDFRPAVEWASDDQVEPARSGKQGRVTERRIAIVQSNYIPWKGYFDLIHSVDEFILFDDVQYTRRDWRNRNVIKTKDGPTWLTIPVRISGRYLSPIKDIEVDGQKWREQHWRTIAASYARAPHFGFLKAAFEEVYRGSSEASLSLINRSFIETICAALSIRTKLSWSMDHQIVEGKTARLVSLCQQAGASTYVSGPSARDYIDLGLFEEAGIAVEFFDYKGYPEYPQQYPPFKHDVSILDLLFNQGPDAGASMLTFGARRLENAAAGQGTP
jgi:WbqC-like protein family